MKLELFVKNISLTFTHLNYISLARQDTYSNETANISLKYLPAKISYPARQLFVLNYDPYL
jgi:hypothetical protein